MSSRGYKKYMKKSSVKDYSLIKIFIFSFVGMLLVFTFLIKTLSPSVDVSIGDYKDVPESTESTHNVDGRLAAIQDEDRGKDFSFIMKNNEEKNKSENSTEINEDNTIDNQVQRGTVSDALNTPPADVIYKVYIGAYTSAEQAKVAKDIIVESNTDLSPIVKCIGSNNYTLQVGIFKNKASAEALNKKIMQNHLPSRIVQEY